MQRRYKEFFNQVYLYSLKPELMFEGNELVQTFRLDGKSAEELKLEKEFENMNLSV